MALKPNTKPILNKVQWFFDKGSTLVVTPWGTARPFNVIASSGRHSAERLMTINVTIEDDSDVPFGFKPSPDNKLYLTFCPPESHRPKAGAGVYLTVWHPRGNSVEDQVVLALA